MIFRWNQIKVFHHKKAQIYEKFNNQNTKNVSEVGGLNWVNSIEYMYIYIVRYLYDRTKRTSRQYNQALAYKEKPVFWGKIF